MGIYVLECGKNCIGYCLDNKVCNIIIGRCDVGCKFGYKGEMCDIGIWKILLWMLLI